MMRIFTLLIILLFISTGCKKYIQEGTKPKSFDKEIPYKTGKVFFKEEHLEVKYVSVQNYIKEDSNDIIFYLHGIYRTELEWVEENGFGSSIFYKVLKDNPALKSFTVVSISLGGAYLLIDGDPSPFSVDLESFFLNKIVPYFKNKFSKTGKIYLISHSLGGFNSLMVSLRNPDKITAIVVISPYVAPISPFSKDFEKKGEQIIFLQI